MFEEEYEVSIDPFHYIRHCLFGKWKMTILRHIHTNGSIRFNQTLKALPISEKVLSEQLKKLSEDGLVRRVERDKFPITVEYSLTQAGEQLFAVLDKLYIWSIQRMDELKIPIDQNTFTRNKDEKYSHPTWDRF